MQLPVTETPPSLHFYGLDSLSLVAVEFKLNLHYFSSAREDPGVARPARGPRVDDQPDLPDLPHPGAASLHLLVPERQRRGL